MPAVIFRAFRDEQRESRYPFGDHCSLISDDGLSLDSGLFIDASLYPAGTYQQLAITSIETSYSEITINVGNAGDLTLASATYEPFQPPDVLPLKTNGVLVGILLPDLTLLSTLTTWRDGTHTFSPGTAEFVPSVILPRPPLGVTSFVLADGTRVSGDVWLVGDAGVVFSQPTDNEIRIDVVGDPLFRRRLCATSDDFESVNYLQTLEIVNGSDSYLLTPDAYGDVSFHVGTRLAATPVLRIRPEPKVIGFCGVGSGSGPLGNG